MVASLHDVRAPVPDAVPDVDRTQLFVCIGGNPVASGGSLMSAPGFEKRVEALRARGGRFVVVDPRRTESAEIADEHLPIRPGTDVYLLLGAAARGVCRRARRPRASRGARRRRRAVACSGRPLRSAGPGRTHGHRPRARGAPRAGDRRRAACAGLWPGRSLHAGVWRAHDLAHLLPQPADGAPRQRGRHDVRRARRRPDARLRLEGHYGKFRSRVRNLPEFGNELPVATLADEILTEGPGRCAALISFAGNPVLSTPNGRQLDRALESLEFMVSVDPYLNETTRHADLILPPTSPLEHSHYDIALSGFAVRNVAKYSPPLFERPAGALHDHEILAELTLRLGTRAGHGTKHRRGEGQRRAPAGSGRVAGLDAADWRLWAGEPRRVAPDRPAARVRCHAQAAGGAGPQAAGPQPEAAPRRPARHRPRSARAGARAAARIAGSAHPAVARRLCERPGPRRACARGAGSVAGADRPPARAQQQFLVAQQPAPREGQAPLHADDPSGRMRPRAASSMAAWCASARASARSRSRRR